MKTFSWSRTWFSGRVKGLELGEPVIKEDRAHLPFRYKLPWFTPLDFLSIDSNLYTLDAYGMELKRGEIQSFASKHGRKGGKLMRKYSHRERNHVLDYVHKFVNKLLEMYPLTTFTVEKLNKQSMFQDADDKLSKKISRTVWRSIHRVLKHKAPLYGSLVKELNSHLTSKSCPRCGRVSRKVGLFVVRGVVSPWTGNSTRPSTSTSRCAGFPTSFSLPLGVGGLGLPR